MRVPLLSLRGDYGNTEPILLIKVLLSSHRSFFAGNERIMTMSVTFAASSLVYGQRSRFVGPHVAENIHSVLILGPRGPLRRPEFASTHKEVMIQNADAQIPSVLYLHDRRFLHWKPMAWPSN